jgi:uncharacterized protein (UPF0335 family)
VNADARTARVSLEMKELSAAAIADVNQSATGVGLDVDALHVAVVQRSPVTPFGELLTGHQKI